MIFEYWAVNDRLSNERGRVEAASAAEAKGALRSRGLRWVRVWPAYEDPLRERPHGGFSAHRFRFVRDTTDERTFSTFRLLQVPVAGVFVAAGTWLIAHPWLSWGSFWPVELPLGLVFALLGLFFATWRVVIGVGGRPGKFVFEHRVGPVRVRVREFKAESIEGVSVTTERFLDANTGRSIGRWSWSWQFVTSLVVAGGRLWQVSHSSSLEGELKLARGISEALRVPMTNAVPDDVVLELKGARRVRPFMVIVLIPVLIVLAYVVWTMVKRW